MGSTWVIIKRLLVVILMNGQDECVCVGVSVMCLLNFSPE